MTAVKEQFLQMLPQNLSGVPDEEVKYMIDILVKWNKPNKKHAEVPFDPKYTDENRAERMARAFALAETIDIDEQEVAKLREASMI